MHIRCSAGLKFAGLVADRPARIGWRVLG